MRDNQVRNVEKTVRISQGNYDRICEIANTTGMGIRELVDSLLSDNLAHLQLTAHDLGETKTVQTLRKQYQNEVDKLKTIAVQEVDGQVYFCQKCHQPLDPDKELKHCPSCDAELNWGEHTRIGMVGWGLIGLAILLALQTRAVQSQ